VVRRRIGRAGECRASHSGSSFRSSRPRAARL
jgi:hypothetical protein